MATASYTTTRDVTNLRCDQESEGLVAYMPTEPVGPNETRRYFRRWRLFEFPSENVSLFVPAAERVDAELEPTCFALIGSKTVHGSEYRQSPLCR